MFSLYGLGTIRVRPDITLASGAVYGCPPRVRTSRKSICGLMRQPANGRNCFAGFVATRTPPRHHDLAAAFPNFTLRVELSNLLVCYLKKKAA